MSKSLVKSHCVKVQNSALNCGVHSGFVFAGIWTNQHTAFLHLSWARWKIRPLNFQKLKILKSPSKEVRNLIERTTHFMKVGSELHRAWGPDLDARKRCCGFFLQNRHPKILNLRPGSFLFLFHLWMCRCSSFEMFLNLNNPFVESRCGSDLMWVQVCHWFAVLSVPVRSHVEVYIYKKEMIYAHCNKQDNIPTLGNRLRRSVLLSEFSNV